MDHNGKRPAAGHRPGRLRRSSPTGRPDGRHVVFDWAAERPGRSPTCTSSTRVTRRGATCSTRRPATSRTGYPVWSPDGSRGPLRPAGGRCVDEGVPRARGRPAVGARRRQRRARRSSPPTPPSRTRPPTGARTARRIAYAADDDIWLMDADGTDVVNLTPGDDGTPVRHRVQPARRPHRLHRAPAGPVPAGERYVQTLRTDGSDRRVVAPTPGLRQAVPAWQPLGRR